MAEDQKRITGVERLANFLSLAHEDCSLNSLPETRPPLSGQRTQADYMREAEKIFDLLRS